MERTKKQFKRICQELADFNERLQKQSPGAIVRLSQEHIVLQLKEETIVSSAFQKQDSQDLFSFNENSTEKEWQDVFVSEIQKLPSGTLFTAELVMGVHWIRIPSETKRKLSLLLNEIATPTDMKENSKKVFRK